MRNAFAFVAALHAFVGVAHAQTSPTTEPPPADSADAGAVEATPPPPSDVVIDLSVTSTPEGAQVIVNRRVVGVTPLDTQLAIPADTTTLRITVQAPGYQPRTREVSPRGGTVVFDAALAPLAPAGGGVGVADGVGPGADAEDPWLGGRRPRHVFGAGFGFFTINNDTPSKTTALTLALDGSFRLLGDDAPGELTMDLVTQWSFVTVFPGSSDAEARPNNPNLILTLGSNFGPVRVYGGPGVTAPVAAAIDDRSNAAALFSHGLTGAMRGYIEPWSFLVSHLGLHGRVGVEARFDAGHFGAEMALGFAPGIEAQYTSVPNYFGWQLLFFGAARPVDFFSVGGRLGVVYVRDLESSSFSGTPLDEIYVSLEPFVRFHFDPGFFGLRFLLNFTDNIGFSFDDNGIWSMTLEGGVAIE